MLSLSHRHHCSPVIFAPLFPPHEKLLTAVAWGAVTLVVVVVVVVVFVPVILSFGCPRPRSTRCPPCEQWLAAVGAGAGCWVAFLVVALLFAQLLPLVPKKTVSEKKKKLEKKRKTYQWPKRH